MAEAGSRQTAPSIKNIKNSWTFCPPGGLRGANGTCSETVPVIFDSASIGFVGVNEVPYRVRRIRSSTPVSGEPCQLHPLVKAVETYVSFVA
jgi:hypothetical protein